MFFSSMNLPWTSFKNRSDCVTPSLRVVAPLHKHSESRRQQGPAHPLVSHPPHYFPFAHLVVATLAPSCSFCFMDLAFIDGSFWNNLHQGTNCMSNSPSLSLLNHHLFYEIYPVLSVKDHSQISRNLKVIS